MKTIQKIDIPELPSWAKEDLPGYYQTWQKQLYRSLLRRFLEPYVIVLRGVGRSGKTCLAFQFLEYADELGIDLYQWGGSSVDPHVPFDIELVDDIDNLHPDNHAVCIADDIAMKGLSARDFNTSEAKEFLRLCTIISHRDITLVLTIQSLRIMDIYSAMSSQKVDLILKYSSSWNILLERDGFIGDIIKQYNSFLGSIMERTRVGKPVGSGSHPSKGWFYSFRDNLPGYSYVPDWYSSEVSKTYG